jgi:hypothetical protein
VQHREHDGHRHRVEENSQAVMTCVKQGGHHAEDARETDGDRDDVSHAGSIRI